MSEFLKDLNKEQYAAVTAPDGPAMVIAGAGSGKTRVLTYRIAYLLNKGIDPFNVLALTFTNKAAREMKERIITLIGDGDARNVWMGTFHSVFARILRFDGSHLGYPSNFTIYDSDDSKRLIRQIIKDKNLDNKTYNPSYVQARISMAKSSLILPDNYSSNAEIIAADTAARKPLISEIYTAYNNRLRRADAMDFDDLLLNTYLLFNNFGEVLYKWQHRFQHILVDEYQDTNHVQYMIIKKLASNNEHVYVVGDDAQSIYSFRGANIPRMPKDTSHDFLVAPRSRETWGRRLPPLARPRRRRDGKCRSRSPRNTNNGPRRRPAQEAKHPTEFSRSVASPAPWPSPNPHLPVLGSLRRSRPTPP